MRTVPVDEDSYWVIVQGRGASSCYECLPCEELSLGLPATASYMKRRRTPSVLTNPSPSTHTAGRKNAIRADHPHILQGEDWHQR